MLICSLLPRALSPHANCQDGKGDGQVIPRSKGRLLRPTADTRSYGANLPRWQPYDSRFIRGLES
jgi:hypothetical protein